MTATLNYLIVATLTFMPAPAVIIIKTEKQSERRSAIVVGPVTVAVVASTAVAVPVLVTTIPAKSLTAVVAMHFLNKTLANFRQGRVSAC